jgi:hypothetical protein
MSRYYKVLIFNVFLLNVFFLFSCNNSTINQQETNFAFEDTSKITKVLIIKQNDTVKLQKIGFKWLVDSKYLVNSGAINRMLNTLRLIQINTPLPANSIKEVNKMLMKQEKIKVYSKDKIVRTFYLGKYLANSGNYAKLLNAKNPYVIFIPSYSFDLRENFSLDIRKWQTTKLFHFKPEQINSISYIDFRNGDKLFMKKIDTNYIVSCDSLFRQKIKTDKETINYYLRHFSNISFVSFIENMSKNDMDSVRKQKPIFKLTLRLTNKKNVSIIAYDFVVDGKENTDEFIGIVDNKTFVLARYYDFDLLRKNCNFFVSKDATK